MSNSNLQHIDYKQLGKLQKLALFMIVIGPDAAADLLKFFEDTDIEMICREITTFKIVDRSIQSKTVEEFAEIIGESLNAILGGHKFAQKALELAKGDYQAINMLGRIAPLGNSSEVIKEVSEMEPRQIFNLIRNEQAQTIAFVISHLSLEKATNMLTMLSPDLREEVIERIGCMVKWTGKTGQWNKVVLNH